MAWSVVGTLRSNTISQGMGVTHTQITLEAAAPVAAEATDTHAAAHALHAIVADVEQGPPRPLTIWAPRGVDVTLAGLTDLDAYNSLS